MKRSNIINRPYIRLGKKLRTCRIHSDLNQAQVAQLLGYSSPQIISNMERGISFIHHNRVKKLCEIYQLSPEKVYQWFCQDYTLYLRKRWGL